MKYNQQRKQKPSNIYITNLSACCYAKVIVITGGEGTSYYECAKCKKPCDITNVHYSKG